MTCYQTIVIKHTISLLQVRSYFHKSFHDTLIVLICKSYCSHINLTKILSLFLKQFFLKYFNVTFIFNIMVRLCTLSSMSNYNCKDISAYITQIPLWVFCDKVSLQHSLQAQLDHIMSYLSMQIIAYKTTLRSLLFYCMHLDILYYVKQ